MNSISSGIRAGLNEPFLLGFEPLPVMGGLVFALILDSLNKEISGLHSSS